MADSQYYMPPSHRRHDNGSERAGDRGSGNNASVAHLGVKRESTWRPGASTSSGSTSQPNAASVPSSSSRPANAWASRDSPRSSSPGPSHGAYRARTDAYYEPPDVSTSTGYRTDDRDRDRGNGRRADSRDRDRDRERERDRDRDSRDVRDRDTERDNNRGGRDAWKKRETRDDDRGSWDDYRQRMANKRRAASPDRDDDRDRGRDRGGWAARRKDKDDDDRRWGQRADDRDRGDRDRNDREQGWGRRAAVGGRAASPDDRDQRRDRSRSRDRSPPPRRARRSSLSDSDSDKERDKRRSPPRWRSPSPEPVKRRAPPSPRLPDAKRARDYSPPPPRRGRSPSRSSSRSRSPTPPRRAARGSSRERERARSPDSPPRSYDSRAGAGAGRWQDRERDRSPDRAPERTAERAPERQHERPVERDRLDRDRERDHWQQPAPRGPRDDNRFGNRQQFAPSNRQPFSQQAERQQRQPSLQDRQSSSQDRQPLSQGRQPLSQDRQPLSQDRPPLSQDRQPFSQGERQHFSSQTERHHFSSQGDRQSLALPPNRFAQVSPSRFSDVPPNRFTQVSEAPVKMRQWGRQASASRSPSPPPARRSPIPPPRERSPQPARQPDAGSGWRRVEPRDPPPPAGFRRAPPTGPRGGTGAPGAPPPTGPSNGHSTPVRTPLSGGVSPSKRSPWQQQQQQPNQQRRASFGRTFEDVPPLNRRPINGSPPRRKSPEPESDVPEIEMEDEDSAPPSMPASRPHSPKRSDPSQERAAMYLDRLADKERQYDQHLSTISPYVTAAFAQWYTQNATPALPEFLVHYFSRQPSNIELEQVHQLLQRRTQLARDQQELRHLHEQALRIEASVPTIAAPLTALTGPSPAGTPSSDSTSRPPRSSRNVTGEAYERLSQVGEGTYGKVYKARNVGDGSLVALKRIRMEQEKDGFPVTSMREIKLLQALHHPNVVRLREMMVSKGSVYMVLEYMNHDLTGILSHPEVSLSAANIKSLNHQMLSGLGYLHRRGILHRDMKGSNILLNGAGELKLADFGLARWYHKHKRDDYTNRVITLWYRSPELLMGETCYGPEVDTWSAGCIMLEIFTTKPVFQGSDEINQLEVIYSILGTPSASQWPGMTELPWYELVRPKEAMASRFRASFAKWLSPGAIAVIEGLLAFDPSQRLLADDALAMPYFTAEEPAMERPTQLAECGEHHEMSVKLERHRRREKQ